MYITINFDTEIDGDEERVQKVFVALGIQPPQPEQPADPDERPRPPWQK